MVPGRAPPRLTSVKTDVRRIERDSQPCSHALTCTQSRPTKSREARVTANTQPPSQRYIYTAIRCPLSATVTFEISHISPPNSFLTILFPPFCSVLSTIINTSVSCVFKHLSNNDGHEEKTSKSPHLRCRESSEGGSLQERSSAIFVAASAQAPSKSTSFLLQALSVAGLGAGLTEAVVVNPFEVVKVSLQANRDAFKEVVGRKSLARSFCEVPFIETYALSLQQPSSFAQARRIIKTDGFGLKGLNKGLTSTLGRHGVFNMIYFGFYFNVKDAIPTSPVTKPSPSLPSLQQAESERRGILTSTTRNFLLPSGYTIHMSRPPRLVGELRVFDSMISEAACLGREEAQIREELVRSAPLIPHLFAPYNILKVSGYTSGRL